MIVVLRAFSSRNLILTLANKIIAILRADNSCQYQLSSQTGARSARHSVRPTIHTENCLKDSHFVGLSGQ